VDDDERLRVWYAQHRDRAADAGRRLRQAIQAALATVLLLAVAVGATVFGPARAPGSGPVRVTGSDGAETCGVLLPSTADGTVRVRRADSGAVDVIAAGAVTRLRPVAAC
jgi:hypothetical protein